MKSATHASLWEEKKSSFSISVLILTLNKVEDKHNQVSINNVKVTESSGKLDEG